MPHGGSIYDHLPVMLQMVQASFATTGGGTMAERHEHAVLEWQFFRALQDGMIHCMALTPHGQLNGQGHGGPLCRATA